ncbi:glycoside hydrolase family 2 protein [Paenibacillus taichungensis]|uniref:glycoside hydrolase family 2 protein n=1 Tax=Paenibacillus taichungensis TaxID=484184 RepID=UPI0035DCCF3A
MIRLFDTHHSRISTELEGLWEFSPVDTIGERPIEFPFKLPVPGCWESHPHFGTYRGKAVYRRVISVSSQTHIRLEFKGVSHTAHVYFDGEFVKTHYNAYTSFEVIIPNAIAGEHEILVYVDNSFSEASALHFPNDYYTYGGLIRPVVLEEISDLYIENIMFTPLRQANQWNGRWKVMIRNISQSPQQVQVIGELAGIKSILGSCEVGSGGQAELIQTVSYPNVLEWSLDHPSLYQLQTKLITNEQLVDDLVDRIGFREINISNGQLLLNGHKLKLKGVNRHEDHPMVGCSFPLSLMVRDLDLIEEMGCNAVRTSHYPYDERFLDLCDERGIVIWEENHARGLSLEQMRNPNFAWQSEQVTREMVEQHFNHPSIIVWAILNECASNTEEGKVHYAKQLTIIRELDPSRPRSFASHHRDQELCFDLAEIVSFNLYPGWYTDEKPEELALEAIQWANKLGGADKPIIMSEFGADGFYGFRSNNREKGSEERQADILRNCLNAYQASTDICGMFIWQFSDCRVTEGEGWLLTRSCTRNSKGLVDEYRRPKLAYDVVSSIYKSEDKK